MPYLLLGLLIGVPIVASAVLSVVLYRRLFVLARYEEARAGRPARPARS